MKGTQSANEKHVDLRLIHVLERRQWINPETGSVHVLYRVQSNSRPDDPEAEHHVKFIDGQLQQCTCLGYRNFTKCYVSTALKEREKPEAVTEELPFDQPDRVRSGATAPLAGRVSAKPSMPALHNATPLRIVGGVPMR